MRTTWDLSVGTGTWSQERRVPWPAEELSVVTLTTLAPSSRGSERLNVLCERGPRDGGCSARAEVHSHFRRPTGSHTDVGVTRTGLDRTGKGSWSGRERNFSESTNPSRRQTSLVFSFPVCCTSILEGRRLGRPNTHVSSRVLPARRTDGPQGWPPDGRRNTSCSGRFTVKGYTKIRLRGCVINVIQRKILKHSRVRLSVYLETFIPVESVFQSPNFWFVTRIRLPLVLAT